MQLSGDLAQRIVNAVMAIVHRNVNLMDGRGVIIGSGHPRRIGTVHEGARQALQSGLVVEISPDDVDRYPGALEGINMPIVIAGDPVAVIGVYGDPPAVRDTASLAKAIAEHILEREISYQATDGQTQLREEFLVHLTGRRGPDIPLVARQLAASLGFDLSLPRCVVIASLGGDAAPLPQEYRPPGLITARLAEVESMLRGQGVLARPDFLGPLDRRLAVLLAVPPERAIATISAQAAAIQGGLSALLDLPVTCAAGSTVDPAALPVSRRQAEFALARCSPRRKTCSIRDRDILLQFLRKSAFEGDGGSAAGPMLEQLARLYGGKPQLRETLAALLEENLDCTAAALRLGIHRNTLGYRLERLAEETGLRPASRFADAALCWFSLEGIGPDSSAA